MYSLLIVDDDWIQRYILIGLIKATAPDFQIFFEAEDGIAALDILRIVPVDAVITDISMPNKDGLKLLQDIKRLYKNIDVILASSYNDFSYAHQGILYGAIDYILKPFNKDNIPDTVNRLRKSIEGKRQKIKSEKLLQDKFDSMYLRDGVAKIVRVIHHDFEKAMLIADEMFDTLYALYEKDEHKLSYTINMFINFISCEIIQLYPWMEKFKVTSCNNSNLETKAQTREYYYSKISKAVYSTLQILKNFNLSQTELIVKQICEYIADNSDERITLEMVAEKFNFSTDYLGKLFKLKTGEYFNDYVTRVKIERAKYLIGTHKYKTYEIAQLLGYKDMDYFSKLFRKYTGKNPSSYKNDMLTYK